MSGSTPRATRASKLLQRLQDQEEVARPKFDSAAAEHRYRGLVLLGVFAMLVSELVVISAAWLKFGIAVGEVKDMAAIILAPTFTLFGAIVGFYFSRGK